MRWSIDCRLLPVTPEVLGIMREILSYLNSGDVVNACKLYLFCRGGQIHLGFEKCGMEGNES